ncbi:MAG: hypothetical protein AAB605_01685 [Patescibacteria group bacterium]
MPSIAFAQQSATETAALILYALIGFSGALAFTLFIGGLIVYFTRFATQRRKVGIDMMVWAVAVMIAVIILIAILRVVAG